MTGGGEGGASLVPQEADAEIEAAVQDSLGSARTMNSCGSRKAQENKGSQLTPWESLKLDGLQV